MKKFEYRQIQLGFDIEDFLNQLGEEGWELIQINGNMAILKREKVNNKEEVFTEAEQPFTHREPIEAVDIDSSSLRIDEGEKELIRHALEATGGRRKEAAARLGFSERTLYRKMKEYGL